MNSMRAAAHAALLLGAYAATPYISVNTTSVNNLDWVRVRFGGLSHDDASDAFIGLFSPSNASVSAIDPLPYPATAPWTQTAAIKYISLSDMNNTSGEGEWDFELINMYTDAKFVLFKGGLNSPFAVATSQPISFKSTPPLRGQLARTNDPSEMRITWNAVTDADGPMVKYGTSPGQYNFSAKATSYTYTKDDLCGEPATGHGWFEPFYWNSAIMTGLQPATMYYFVYGSDANGWSAEGHFRSAELANPHTPLNLIVYADMGMTELDGSTDHWAEPYAWMTTQHMIDAAATGDFSLALHVGDVAYATGYEAKWNLFSERLSNLATIIPVMVGLGNHERDYPGTGAGPAYATSVDSGGECGVPAVTRYRMPWGDDWRTAVNQSWYTIVQGPMTCIMLNSELSVDPDSPQYNYLAASLAAVDRKTTPWLFVAFHRPIYYGGERDSNLGQIEALLNQYQVDLVLTGHVHNAEVYCPINNMQCVTAQPGAYDAPIHTVIGNAGMDLTPAGNSSNIPILTYQAIEYGYSTIKIESAESLTMYFYADIDNALHYNFTITRKYPRAM